MGSHISIVKPNPKATAKRKLDREVRDTHRALTRHPNFNAPSDPRRFTDAALISYVVDYCAAFVSPKKVAGENEEFSCQAVAGAMKKLLKKEIIQIVRMMRDDRGVKKIRALKSSAGKRAAS